MLPRVPTAGSRGIEGRRSAIRTGLRARSLACLGAALLVVGCSTAERARSGDSKRLGGLGQPYEVAIVGVGGQLAARLKDVSVLFSKKSEPPATLQGLKRRAHSDRDVYLRVLRSRGFYEGTVVDEVDATKSPVRVSMRVERGPRYKIVRFELEGLPPEAAELTTTEGLASLGVIVGAPALAETVLGVEPHLVTALSERSYPYAQVSKPDSRIDRGAKTMEVRIRVDPGPRTRFGEVQVEGLTRMDEDFVRGRLKFARGEDFSPQKIEETRRALFETGVFSAVSLTWGTRADVSPTGEAPIRLVLAEGDARTVGTGVKYSSAEGFGGRVYWEHRNLRGGAERLRAEVEVTQLLSTGGVSYREPDWRKVGQTLLLDATADADDTNAYDRFAIVLSAGIERPLLPHLVGTVGVALEEDQVDGKTDPGTQEFALFGVPIGLRYDGSDNLLDPTTGHRAFLSVTPYLSFLGDNVEMFMLRGGESFYVALTKSRRQVWATRVTLGSILGASRSEVPADKRFYAGGGDSVRGYQYQIVGRLDDDHDPYGGRSLLQAGTELRFKVTDTLGVVPFFEGAGVFDSSYPDFREAMQWGAGLGFRYFTVAGPLRFDVAFPVNPRRPDGIFEVYISLGQAF